MEEGGLTYDPEPPPYPEFAQMSGTSTVDRAAPHIQLQLQPSVPTSMASSQMQPMQLGVAPSAPLVESGFVTIPRSQSPPETMYSSRQMLVPAESLINPHTLTLQTASPMQQPSASLLQQPVLSVGSQGQTPPDAPPGKHYPMFFSTETGKILMNIDGFYHVVPHPINDMGLQSDRPLIHLQVSPGGRPPARSGQEQEDASKQRPPSDYYACTFVMICVTVLCLDIIVLLFCLAPALYFSTKAKNAKMAARYRYALKYGTKSLAFNTIGGILHVLYLCGVVATVCCILLLVVRVQG